MTVQLRLVLASLAALAVPSAAIAAEHAAQFDLMCQGVQTFSPLSKPVAANAHYRINLTEMRWCWERCERTFPILSATVDRITFFDDPDHGLHAYISRIDGSYFRGRYNRRESWIDDKGKCEPAPYSGMPQPRF